MDTDEITSIVHRCCVEAQEFREVLTKIAALRKDNPSPDARYAQALAEDSLERARLLADG